MLQEWLRSGGRSIVRGDIIGESGDPTADR
jgi:hypothetical protein